MSEDRKRFIEALKSEDVLKIKELLVNGFNVNHQNEHGYTLLHCAVSKNSYEIVKLLLRQENVDVNLKSKQNLTPLQLALLPSQYQIHIEIVEMLIKKDPLQVNSTERDRYGYGQTFLEKSIFNNRIDLLKCFVENGADVNLNKNEYGRTCLHKAAQLMRLDMIDYLLENTNIDSKIKDANGKSALWWLLSNPLYLDYKISTCKKLVDRTFEIDPSTQHSKFEDFFECTFIACRRHWNHSLGSKPKYNLSEFFIRKFYSKNNTKYYLIEQLLNSGCKIENYCLLALVHDRVNREIIQQHYDNLIGSILHAHEELMQKAVETDEINVVVLELFEFLTTIRFYDKYFMESFNRDMHSPPTPLYFKSNGLGEWSMITNMHNTYMNSICRSPYNIEYFVEDFTIHFGYYILPSVGKMLTTESSCYRLYKVIKFFSKILDIDKVLVIFLECCLQSSLKMELLNKVFLMLHPFTLHSGFVISMAFSEALRYRIDIQPNVRELLESYYDPMNLKRTYQRGVYGDQIKIFSLKHICRYNIRAHLLRNSKSDRFKFFEKLEKLDSDGILPKSLNAYLRNDEIYGRA